MELPFVRGKVIAGGDYLMDLALPNFFFHVTIALPRAGCPGARRNLVRGLAAEPPGSLQT